MISIALRHGYGAGDISPMTEAEIIVVMFCIVAGIVFFGVLLGSIAEALTVRGRMHASCTCVYGLPAGFAAPAAKEMRQGPAFVIVDYWRMSIQGGHLGVVWCTCLLSTCFIAVLLPCPAWHARIAGSIIVPKSGRPV